MTNNLEIIHDEHRDRLITMSENNGKLLTVASGRDDRGNWVIMSRKHYNSMRSANDLTGKKLLDEIF